MRRAKGYEASAFRSWIPYFLLIASLLASFIAGSWLQTIFHRKTEYQFERAVDAASYNVGRRMTTYITILKGVAGLFDGNPAVSLDQFEAQIARQGVNQNYPGVQGIGFVRVFKPGELRAVENRIRKLYPGVPIRPQEREGDFYTAIEYIVPPTGRNERAIGYDMYQEPVRRAAMDAAVRTGQAAMSGQVYLMQETEVDRQPGFLIYVPLYRGGIVPMTVQERRQKLLGFVYSPFRAHNLMAGILRSEPERDVELRVYDAGDTPQSEPLFSSESFSSSSRLHASRELVRAGRKWRLEFTPSRYFLRNENEDVISMVTVGGVIFSFIVFAVSLLESRARADAQTTATALEISSQKLLREEARYRTMVTEVKDYAIFLFDTEGKITSWNAGVAETLGYTEAEFIGMPVHLLFPAELWTTCKQELERAKSDGRTRDSGWRLRKDGSLIWIVGATTSLTDQQGTHTGFVRLMRDFTAEKRGEDALREETQTTDTLYRIGRNLAGRLDSGSLIQMITDEATALTGAQFGAFFYNTIGEDGESYMLYTLSGVDREAFSSFPMPRKTEIFAPTFEGIEVVRSDDIIADSRYGKNEPYGGMPKGHLPVRSYLAVPVISSGGSVLGGLFFGHEDVGVFTERHERLVVGIAGQASVALDNARLYEEAQQEIRARIEAEEQIREMNQELEQRVAERTSQLQAANQELESFCHSVSHDLRTPLRSIVANSRFLIEDYSDRLPEAAKADLRSVAASAQRVAQLVNDLLTYARIGRADLDRRPVDLTALSKGVAEELHIELDNQSCSFQVEPDLVLDGDPDLIKLLVRNLLENACKYRHESRDPSIEIGRDGDEFFVRDNGIGFDMAFSHKLFLPFERLHSDSSIPGTGIGLANVKRIVDLHGGTVRAESTPGEGATFFFMIPYES